jgi:hypothetical protein
MQPEAIAEAVNHPADYEFRRRVLGFDRGHDPRALAFAEYVHGSTEFGSRSANGDNPRIMTKEQIEELKRDFQEWSGGFEPDSECQIVMYADYARDSSLDRDEVVWTLQKWMGEQAESAA